MNLKQFTYFQNRKCRYCRKPIPDQEHGLRKFCQTTDLPNGNRYSCKEFFHARKKKISNRKYCGIVKHFKKMDFALRRLINEKGNTVTVEDLNHFGINLQRPVEFVIIAGKNHFFFSEYFIEQNGNDFKITNHDRIY
jgi:hypothetical protein